LTIYSKRALELDPGVRNQNSPGTQLYRVADWPTHLLERCLATAQFKLQKKPLINAKEINIEKLVSLIASETSKKAKFNLDSDAGLVDMLVCPPLRGILGGTNNRTPAIRELNPQ